MASHTKPLRYRVEDGRTCIDIRLRDVRQLFDLRDPAPFRERDLDEDAVEYICAAAEEIAATAELKVVLHFEERGTLDLPAAAIEAAVRAHFTYAREQVNRRLRQQRRFGRLTLAVGLSVLVTLLSLAQLVRALPLGAAGEILREGLVITGWVAMWRPLEVLLYDWWPLVQTRRRIERILAAPIEVRVRPPA